MCKKTIPGPEATKIFFKYVWVYFGLPKSIILARDSHFLSHFWMTLWQIMDTKLKWSMVFHLQTNSHIEVVNREFIYSKGIIVDI